jgi:hypothetical protein
MSNRLICYIEKEKFKKVTIDAVVNHFRNMVS